tara:strand:- start:19904 stop:21097 length:1194 start_codon:yes stop_codon:yes gene_type:complete
MDKTNFPIFENHPDLIYLDSASTSQRPKQVIDSLTNFYEKENANVSRGVYILSEESTKKYNDARKKVERFLNSNEKEIIFTKSSTESINLLASIIKSIIPEGRDEIILSEMEHHSNLIPWQEFAKKYNFKLRFIPIMRDYTLDYKKLKELITDKTAIVSIIHASNVFGVVNDVEKIIKLSKEKGAISIIDAAQSIQHMKIDVKDLDCDFLVFSAHKMFGPMGIGVLFGKKDLLQKLTPYQFGGGMINSVEYDRSTFADLPEKFEAGTQNIAGAISLGVAIDYLEDIGFENIQKHEKELLEYALVKMETLDKIKIYHSNFEKSVGIISFNLEGIHPHDVASILSEYNISIRSGHHCCMPLIKKLGIQGTCRISLSVYNSKEDIDKLVDGLKKVLEVFD